MKIGIPPVNESPDDSDVHFLDDRINEYNVETTGITDGSIVSFFVRDELGDIIAGLYGWTWGGTCAVQQPSRSNAAVKLATSAPSRRLALPVVNEARRDGG